TKSGVGASDQIRRAFKSYGYKEEKYLSADSAYCNQNTIKTCMGLGVKFSITANQATTSWQNHLDEITNWVPWEYSKEEVKQADERGKQLLEVELGRFYWTPSWNEALRLPVVVKRTKVDQGDLFLGSWKHYGVVTNLALKDWPLQKVMEHHNKRGNVENFIREEKYGYDLKHFPCQKLKANHAFGQMAMVAHNILRWVAIHDRPDRPKFAKGIRNKFIHIPGKIVSHARTLTLRVPEYFIEEVNRLRIGLQLKPYSALATTIP
ncbi:MAG: transposase, partial [Desulfonauticus sp.]|nr:transposase [Desulfonauticus sp.]